MRKGSEEGREEELRVHGLVIEQLGVVAEILRKHQLQPPLLLACLLERLDDVLDEDLPLF